MHLVHTRTRAIKWRSVPLLLWRDIFVVLRMLLLGEPMYDVPLALHSRPTLKLFRNEASRTGRGGSGIKKKEYG